MKRDMELIRKILFKIEDEVNNVAVHNIKIEEYSMQQVAYHCALLREGGYIYDYNGYYGDGELYSFGVGRLTWKGHDFLDNIREDNVWNKTKETISSKGLPFAFDIVKSVSSNIISALVKAGLGT